MTNRVEIGKVCYKGNHFEMIGSSDYGICGSHEWITVYAELEIEYPNPRGESYTEVDLVRDIERIGYEADQHMWCGTDLEG